MSLSAQNLLSYFHTNYSKCNQHPSFLTSWQGLANTSHSIQVFGLPIHVLTAYLIIWKSPKSMNIVKWPLLNSHLWCSLCDFGHGTLLTPYYFIPSLAGFHVGLLSIFHVPTPIQLLLLMFLMLGMVVSIIYLFESRSSSIPENPFRITRRATRILYYGAIFSSSSLVALLLLKSPEDQEGALIEILKTIPCPPIEEFFTVPPYVFLIDPFWISAVTFFIIPAIYLNALIHVVFHTSCCIFYLYLSPSLHTSAHTRTLQRRFFIASTIQANVPFIVVIVPFAAGTIALAMGEFNQGFMNFLVIVIGVHGIVESITVILLHHAYREWIWSCFQKNKVRSR